MNYTVHWKANEGIPFNHYTHLSPPLDSMSMHIHNDYEILYIVGGEVTHIVEDRKYKLKKDDLVIVRPHTYHFIRIDKSVDYERYDVLFDPTHLAVDNVSLLPEEVDVINCKHLPFIKELFARTDFFASHLPAEELPRALSLLLPELIYHLSIIDGPAAAAESANPLVRRLLQEINEDLFAVRSIAEIARRLSVSESYVYRLFSDELGTTPLRYINEKRMHFARNLLLAGCPATEVAAECGFADYSSFYRGYKKLFGHSPAEEKGGA